MYGHPVSMGGSYMVGTFSYRVALLFKYISIASIPGWPSHKPADPIPVDTFVYTAKQKIPLSHPASQAVACSSSSLLLALASLQIEKRDAD